MATLSRPIRAWTITPDAIVVTALGSTAATNIRTMRLLMSTGVTLGAWTVDYSCDSVTAGTKADGVNLWVADANVVGAAPGVAHSWIVLTGVGSVGQICFDRDSTAGQLGSTYWSAAAGFTGGTTTNRPTATDEVEITSSTAWLYDGALGSINVHAWVCTTAGQEGLRFAFTHSTATATGPIAMFTVEREVPIATAFLASPPIIARWTAANSTAAGQRGSWGWQTRISGTNRTLTVDGLIPQSVTDADGDRLIDSCALTNVTIGFIGWAEDFFFCHDSITNLATFSDVDGTRGWVVFDQTVWPWDNATSLGVADIAGAKIKQLYVPVVVTVQYTMRAFNTALSQYVYWTVNDTPDTTGSESPYNPGDLTNIVISRKIHPEA